MYVIRGDQGFDVRGGGGEIRQGVWGPLKVPSGPGQNSWVLVNDFEAFCDVFKYTSVSKHASSMHRSMVPAVNLTGGYFAMQSLWEDLFLLRIPNILQNLNLNF